ncbi:hypothetical protein J5N97_003810 [Dioscorea zingiberensis]|uniref:Uncharacterized protein n=1 Tax=Dioscorea zingiberensis TaxID=325984 RepID=A0A9D5D664_9LILI|nr:hypothetical protein J5N97_003810 [Dioscorea zingiberensis]
MCILCVVQRWSRRVATMLPWLVLPLLLMWALSLLGPPHLRFEITSPRLACVSVLLVTAFWYEILMPQLSVWRTRRSARLRERRRAQALELHKLRKAATRRCRNCLTPYRDQNPGGGRFMCFYCGHVSKRPVLDLPGGASPSSRINGWICAQDWGAEGNGNWVSPVPRYWVGNSGGGDELCMTERSYSGAFLFVCKLLSCFFVSTRWILRKVFRAGSSSEDVSDGDNKGLLRKGENGGSSQESRGEKARRKAEEKRQARLEKEMLEQEERKQREEVARLVEERRKLREEILEAERIHSRGSGHDGDREKRKESDKRRQERRKEKDKDRGSSKSNSDVEECERACRENEKKHEFDKKSELGRKDTTRTMADKYKLQALEAGNATKGVIASKQKHFDHVKGSFLTPSRGFNGSSLFGRSAQVSAVTKVSKSSTGYIDHTQGSAARKETQFGSHIMGKSTLTADDRILKSNFNKAVGSEVRPQTPAPKKSWHHLFTCSSAVSPCDDMNTINYPNQNGMSEAQSSQMADQRALHSHSLDNRINPMQQLPFRLHPAINGLIGDNVIPHLSPSEHIFCEQEQNSTLEEAEIFGDPCYDPDPVSLLGPVSDSLDNFPPDLVAAYDSQSKFGEPQNLKRISTIAEVSRPSPIESPLSKSRVSEERHDVIGQPLQTIKTKNEANNANEQNTWQMWGTPLAQDELGLVAKSSGWFSPFGLGKSNQDIMMQPLSLNPMIPQSAVQNYSLPSVHSSLNDHGLNYQNVGTFNQFGHVLNENDIWTRDTLFKPLPVDEESRFLPLDIVDKTARNEVVYANMNSTEASHPFELPPANHWSKKDWPPSLGTQNAGNSIPAPHTGSLFSTGPDVQSDWDFNQKGKNIATIPSLLK